MIGILMLLFVIPFILALVTLIAYGEFRVPDASWMGGLLAGLDANFLLAMVITVMPLLLVWAVESSRARAGQDRRRTTGLTLGLLIALMVVATAVPVVAYLRPLAGVPTGQAVAILSVVALPLLVVIGIVALLLPGVLSRQADGNPEG
jgi:hypothetical protein